ncbi:MAG TPA: sigma-70 family RNA polymerase sigma factor [Polyangiaceae bacterium]
MAATTMPAPNEAAVSAEALFRQHAPFVARFLFRLGVPPDAIDDAVQEVFLVVHRQGGYRPGPARPTSYLANLSLHAASAHRRSERRRRDRESDAPLEDVAAASGGPVEVLETNESLRRVEGLLARLEPELRTTLILAEMEGESCASIAAAMRIPVGTVYWRLHQARKKFQKALQALEAARPRRELAVHAAGVGYPRLQKERTGMFVVWMASSSWHGSEASDLLRLGSGRHLVRYALEEGLARHKQLAASGVPTPSWAGGAGAASVGAAPVVAAFVALAAVAAIAIASERAVTSPTSAPSRAAIKPSAVVVAPRERGGDWAPSPTLAAAASPAVSDAVAVERLPRAAVSAVSAVSAVAPARRSAPPADPVDPSNAADSVPASPDELVELREVAEAERALATDPAGALARVRAVEARFPYGYLEEERHYVEVMALLALGRLAEANPKVSAFLRAYPDGAFGRRIREASRPSRLNP